MRYSGLGLQMMVTIGVFITIGYLLDRHFETPPVFILIFSFIGIGAGFYHFIKSLPKS
jgi:F0F1-type ATP synthase assembly protein I